VIALPGGEGAGRRVADPVRIQDVAPTLLDFAGAAPLAQVDGATLRPLFTGADPAPRDAFARLYDPAPWFVNVREAWRDARFSVIRHFVTGASGFEQVRDAASGEPIFHVFDRSSDPAEKAALLPTDPRYRDAVERYRRAWRTEQSFLATVPRSPRAERLVVDRDPLQRAQLEALGYASRAANDSEPRPELVLPPP
jgi:arylsulfatase A-like enzyme